MGKLIIALLSITFLCLDTFATGIADLNGLVSTPGFSFAEGGRVVTDWQPKVGNRVSGKGNVIYNSVANKATVTLNYSENSDIPINVIIESGIRKEFLMAEPDSQGNINVAMKCTDSVCATVSRNYCNRVYQSMGVKSGAAFAAKVAECSMLENLQPLAVEAREFSSIRSNLEVWKPSTHIFWAPRQIEKETKWFQGFNDSVKPIAAISDRIFKKDDTGFSSGKTVAIANLCAAILPQEIPIANSAPHRTTQ